MLGATHRDRSPRRGPSEFRGGASVDASDRSAERITSVGKERLRYWRCGATFLQTKANRRPPLISKIAVIMRDNKRHLRA